jgi:nucleotidyltransferase/DNA polymerase involved in DNA repair
VSLCPSLTLLEPDPAHYEAAHEAMVETLSGITPVVEPATEGGPAEERERGKVFLGMDGLGRLYGSPPNQVQRALQTLFRVFPPPLVAATRAGYAPGTFGAWVAAAASGPGHPVIVAREDLVRFLAPCPIAALPVGESMIQRLERLGVETLGALARLPEPALAAQFGEEGRKARAWAIGERVDPVRPLRRHQPIRAALDFPAPVGRIGTLHGALDRLLDRALSRPDRRGRSVVGVRVGGRLEGGGSWAVEHVRREPSSRRRDLAFPLRSRMELTPPPRAVESLSVELFQFGPPAHQSDLFDRRQANGRATLGRELADGEVPPSLRSAVKELKLRLGYSPLYRVVEVDPWSRIPERRHALLSFDP